MPRSGVGNGHGQVVSVVEDRITRRWKTVGAALFVGACVVGLGAGYVTRNGIAAPLVPTQGQSYEAGFAAGNTFSVWKTATGNQYYLSDPTAAFEVTCGQMWNHFTPTSFPTYQQTPWNSGCIDAIKQQDNP